MKGCSGEGLARRFIKREGDEAEIVKEGVIYGEVRRLFLNYCGININIYVSKFTFSNWWFEK